ncbi:transposase [Flavobacterium hibernum]|nr:transposase [Flavobacterium hibernum]
MQKNQVLKTLTFQSILNYFDNRSTNASAESFNAKIKTFRPQFRGVRNIDFFLFRLSNLFTQSLTFEHDPKSFYFFFFKKQNIKTNIERQPI